MSETIVESTEETAFLDLHKKFVEENKSSSALSAIHESALSRFEMLGFPHSKHEMYTYVNTKKLAATTFAVSNPSVKIDLIEKKTINIQKLPGDSGCGLITAVSNPGNK